MTVRIDGEKEMKLENFYARVKVGIADKEVKDRLQSLLDDLVSRLPDEKQFQTRGIIGFAKSEDMIKYWNSFSQGGILGKNIREMVAAGYSDVFTTKPGDICSYFIFIPTDQIGPLRPQKDIKWGSGTGPILPHKCTTITNYSDDMIKGLIIHGISNMSYSWNLLQQEKSNLIKLSPKEKEVRINQILGNDLENPSYEYFEMENKISAEAVRLGFEKEKEAFFGKGTVYDEIEKCWRRQR